MGAWMPVTVRCDASQLTARVVVYSLLDLTLLCDKTMLISHLPACQDANWQEYKISVAEHGHSGVLCNAVWPCTSAVPVRIRAVLSLVSSDFACAVLHLQARGSIDVPGLDKPNNGFFAAEQAPSKNQPQAKTIAADVSVRGASLPAAIGTVRTQQGSL
jgi:hypothetical protein